VISVIELSSGRICVSTMTVIKFGTFELDLVNKKLTESGRPYQLGKKALDLLVALAGKAGEIVQGRAAPSRLAHDNRR